jgi:predicted ATPase/class 3 adenylate cyclase
MGRLPSGTVTLLFSDVEGSTRLLEEQGDAYAGVLGEYRRLLREAASRHGGVEVDTQGDAFFIAFARASDAVAAAGEAQQALQATPVRARMGIHTGEPAVTDEGYVGIDVVRGARIAAAGHGGQVLLSRTAYDLLEVDVGVRDLGEYRLKDLSALQRLFQLGDGRFPPLRTLHQTNLPVQATPLIGRQRELAEVSQLLRRHRLVTLVGPGGTGKTRLALHVTAEAAEEFRDGVWWVSLAALADADLVESAIAEAVGARHSLTEYLRSQRALLLLDNFEHVRRAAPRVAELLREAPEVVVLATSRAPLRITGEQEYPVRPMVEEEATALFSERAKAIKPDFQADEHVRAICRRLEGLPLALELAAARVRVLPPAKLAARLERALPVLAAGTRDAPRRQQTLRATLEWSHDLLDEAEQQLFARLAVFAGSFSLEAAEQICDATLDLLQSLVENNLLRADGSGRFSFLETVREFARERLDESGDVEGAARRHARFYLGVAEDAKPLLGQAHVLAALVEDEPNFRAVLALGPERDPGLMLRLAGSLSRFWFARGQFVEAREWLERALEGDASGRSLARADALYALSAVLFLPEDAARRRDLLEEAIALFREHGDNEGLARSLNGLGVAFLEDAADRSHRDAEQALDSATELFEESLGIRRRLGDRVDPGALASPISNLAEVAFARGDFATAQRLTSEMLAVARAEADERYIASANQRLAWIAFLEGRNDDAAGLLRERLRFAHTIRSRWPGTGLALAALIAARRGKHAEAAKLLGALKLHRTRLGVHEWERPRGKRIAGAIRATEQELLDAGYAFALGDAPELSLEDMHELALRVLD